jgi:hypothetical protein
LQVIHGKRRFTGPFGNDIIEIVYAHAFGSMSSGDEKENKGRMVTYGS